VLMHELGHAIGFADNQAYAVMDEDLEPGVRYLLDELGLDGDPDQPIDDQALAALAARAAERSGSLPSFDLDFGTPQAGAGARIDWQAGEGSGWSSGYSPYAAPEARSGGNFADYLVKLFRGKDAGGDSYDSLGKALLGSKDKGRRG
jgi:hypothetical protein